MVAQADEGTLARAAFARAWFRSLLETGADISDEELLDAVAALEAQLARMRDGEAELEKMAAKGRALMAGGGL